MNRENGRSVLCNCNMEKYYTTIYIWRLCIKNNGILLFKNKEYHIPPKELGVIILLLNADGEIVSKEEIIDKVWSASVASDESLTRCIYALRKLLHENKQCKYIETVYGRGYRFTVPIVIVTDNEPVKSTTTLAVFPFVPKVRSMF